MTTPTTVDVPVRPHVKAYIENNFFLRTGQMWKHVDPLWPVFEDYLEGKRTSYTYQRKKNTHYISVTLNCDKNTNYRNIMTDDKAEKFNDLVEKLLMLNFCTESVLLKQHTKLKTQTIIGNYMQKYCFDDNEMNFERLKKALYRYELKLKNQQDQAKAA